MLNLEEEDLPRSSLSVVLIGIASDNSEIGDDKITLSLTAREYIDNKNNSSLSFELYHFPEDAHLMPISSKISRGTSLYVTGHLSIIEDLLLVKITQINFVESITPSTSYKHSNYSWEKKQVNNSSSSTLSATDIAKSLSEKNKKGKQKSSPLSRPQKIPKLSNLSLIQPNMDNISQDETSSPFQLNVNNDNQSEIQHDNFDNANEQDDEIIQKPRKKRGRKKN